MLIAFKSALPDITVITFCCLFFLQMFTKQSGDITLYLSPSFSGCSIGAVPCVDVFLMYLWGGR